MANGWCPPLQTMTEPWLLVTARANGSPPIQPMRPWEQTYLTPWIITKADQAVTRPVAQTLEQVYPTNNRVPSETAAPKNKKHALYNGHLNNNNRQKHALCLCEHKRKINAKSTSKRNSRLSVRSFSTASVQSLSLLPPRRKPVRLC